MGLRSLWDTVRGFRRSPSPLRMFGRAKRRRDDGFFEEAADLVARGLRVDPDNLVGLLLAASLHVVFREIPLARAAFERVLGLDPLQPRALLGLARIAFEEGDADACTGLLTRALARYPDFPEAQALLGVVASARRPDAVDRADRPAPALSLEHLGIPAGSHETLLARGDAGLILAQPPGRRAEDLAAWLAQLCRVAGAVLAGSELGPLRRAVIHGSAGTRYVRTSGDLLLSMTFGRDADRAAAVADVERVWASCGREFAGRAG